MHLAPGQLWLGEKPENEINNPSTTSTTRPVDPWHISSLTLAATEPIKPTEPIESIEAHRIVC